MLESELLLKLYKHDWQVYVDVHAEVLEKVLAQHAASLVMVTCRKDHVLLAASQLVSYMYICSMNRSSKVKD